MTRTLRNRKLQEIPSVAPLLPLAVGVLEFARLMGISKSEAYKLVNNGRVPSVQLGERRVVPRRWIEETIDRAMGAGAAGDE